MIRSLTVLTYTVFPRSLTVARFNFKVLYHAATIRGQRTQRSTRTCVNSFNNEPICMHVAFIRMSWLKLIFGGIQGHREFEVQQEILC